MFLKIRYSFVDIFFGFPENEESGKAIKISKIENASPPFGMTNNDYLCICNSNSTMKS